MPNRLYILLGIVFSLSVYSHAENSDYVYIANPSDNGYICRNIEEYNGIKRYMLEKLPLQLSVPESCRWIKETYTAFDANISNQEDGMYYIFPEYSSAFMSALKIQKNERLLVINSKMLFKKINLMKDQQFFLIQPVSKYRQLALYAEIIPEVHQNFKRVVVTMKEINPEDINGMIFEERDYIGDNRKNKQSI